MVRTRPDVVFLLVSAVCLAALVALATRYLQELQRGRVGKVRSRLQDSCSASHEASAESDVAPTRHHQQPPQKSQRQSSATIPKTRSTPSNADEEGVFHGRLLAKRSRLPVAGAGIRVRSLTCDAIVAGATSCTAGRFRFTLPTRMTGHIDEWIEISAPGYAWVSLPLPRVRNNNQRPHVFELEVSGRLRGRIVGLKPTSEDVLAVQAIIVGPQSQRTETGPGRAIGWTVPLGKLSTYDLPQLPTGEVLVVRLVALAQPLRKRTVLRRRVPQSRPVPIAERRVILSEGEVRVLDFVIPGTGTISGVVRDQFQHPVGGAYISVHRSAVHGTTRGALDVSRTNVCGRYFLTDVPFGNWFLCASREFDPPERRIACLPVLACPSPTSPNLQIDLQVFREVTISGIVTDHRGLPIPDSTVSARIKSPTASASYHTYSLSGGRFALQPVVPGEYEITCLPPVRSNLSPSESLTTRAGSAPLRIILRPGGTIRVVVQSIAPHDPSSIVLMAVPQAAEGRIRLGLLHSPPDRHELQIRHTYAFKGLRRGTYSVYACTSSEVGSLPAVSSEPHAITEAGVLRLQRAAFLRLRSTSNKPIAVTLRCRDGLLLRDYVSGGADSLFRVPPGIIIVTTAGGAGRQERSLRVVATEGQTTEINMRDLE